MTDQPLQNGSHLLVVDDDRLCRTTHRLMLAKHFAVTAAASGEEALALCAQELPDLVLLDVTMPGLDGYQTCRLLRERHPRVPIIFVTACQTLDEHLHAFEAGGDDLIVKPVEYEILVRKIQLALQRHADAAQLQAEKQNLQQMAMQFLSSAGENGTLLNFTRAAIQSPNYYTLARRLVDAIGAFDLSCSVMIRHGGETTIRTSAGQPSPLEQAILEHASTMGRIFQLGSQCVFNYDHVSIVVRGLPGDEERLGRIRDNLTILAETTEALCDNVAMRQQSGEHAAQLQLAQNSAVAAVERLRLRQQQISLDTRLLLQEMIDGIEKAYAWLDTAPNQEAAINTTMEAAVHKVLEMLGAGNEQDAADFQQVLDVLRNSQALADDVGRQAAWSGG